MTFTVRTRYGSRTYQNVSRVTVDHEGNLRLFRRRGRWRQTANVFHPAYEWEAVSRAPDEQAVLESPTDRYRRHVVEAGA